MLTSAQRLKAGTAWNGGRAMATLSLWWRRSRTRAAMASLDERMLKDLGIGYFDAWQESRKWFWQR